MSEIKKFWHGQNSIWIEIANTNDDFSWRLGIDGEWSPWTRHYSGVLEFKGWMVATAYWKGVFPEFTPFKVIQAKEQAKEQTEAYNLGCDAKNDYKSAFENPYDLRSKEYADWHHGWIDTRPEE